MRRKYARDTPADLWDTPGRCVRARRAAMKSITLHDDASPAEMAGYLAAGIDRLTGSNLPVPGADAILAAFAARFGQRDHRVVRAAFEVHQGLWLSAPITASRFRKSNDAS